MKKLAPIRWARFFGKVSLAPGAPTVDALADCGAKLGKVAGMSGLVHLFYGTVAGVPHIIIENEHWKMPANIPLTNVTSWG